MQLPVGLMQADPWPVKQYDDPTPVQSQKHQQLSPPQKPQVSQLRQHCPGFANAMSARKPAPTATATVAPSCLRNRRLLLRCGRSVLVFDSFIFASLTKSCTQVDRAAAGCSFSSNSPPPVAESISFSTSDQSFGDPVARTRA
jgi:hypothetical protein